MTRWHLFKLSFFFVAMLAATSPSYADDKNPPLPTPVGRVVWINGSLKAIMANKEERLLQKTSVIYEHDTLVTGDNSQAQIVFTDNTLMTFRPQTTFIVSQYEYHPSSKKKAGSVGKYVMNLLEGGFRTITGLIAKNNPSDYRVNTPVATIGVRGTDYTVYFHGGQIYIGYYEGTPCITGGDSSGDKAKTLCLNSDEPYAYIPEGSTVPVPLSERPDVFQEKLEITPATITPFVGSTQPATNYSNAPSGPITSFCITQ